MIIDASFQPAQAVRFIALEGVNGAGKSTLQNKIRERLVASGREVVTTREPGGTELGKKLRNMLLNERVDQVSPWAELFLFSADRVTHIDEVIRPAVESGKAVITDRYFYSTIAFQGYGRGLDLGKISSVCEIAVQKMIPDLVILLDLDPEEGLKRNRADSSLTERDAFEGEELQFHRRIREGFLKLAKERPEPFLVINAAKSPDQVFAEAASILDKFQK